MIILKMIDVFSYYANVVTNAGQERHSLQTSASGYFRTSDRTGVTLLLRPNTIAICGNILETFTATAIGFI